MNGMRNFQFFFYEPVMKQLNDKVRVMKETLCYSLNIFICYDYDLNMVSTLFLTLMTTTICYVSDMWHLHCPEVQSNILWHIYGNRPF